MKYIRNSVRRSNTSTIVLNDNALRALGEIRAAVAPIIDAAAARGTVPNGTIKKIARIVAMV